MYSNDLKEHLTLADTLFDEIEGVKQSGRCGVWVIRVKEDSSSYDQNTSRITIKTQSIRKSDTHAELIGTARPSKLIVTSASPWVRWALMKERSLFSLPYLFR